jgi:hypothetical protein
MDSGPGFWVCVSSGEDTSCYSSSDHHRFQARPVSCFSEVLRQKLESGNRDRGVVHCTSTERGGKPRETAEKPQSETKKPREKPESKPQTRRGKNTNQEQASGASTLQSLHTAEKRWPVASNIIGKLRI